MILGRACHWSQVELSDLANIQDYPTKTGLAHKIGTFQNVRLAFMCQPHEPYTYHCLGHHDLPCTLVCPWVPDQPYVLNVKCKKEGNE